MLIQDMNHIEVAQTEIVGAGGSGSNSFNNSFSTTNSFLTEIKNDIQLGRTASASFGSAADASSNMSVITFSKADGGARVIDGRSSSFATGAAAIQYGH
jgi:hypothetical protein